MIEMTDERAAEVLAAHNEWRRYDGFPGEPGAPTMGDPAELGQAIDHVVSRLLAQPPAEAKPVAWQLQDRDGKCHGFMDERHRQNTIADGSWPVRALYTAPPSAPVGVEGLASALQSMRDRMMTALPPKFGDAFDGDFDTLLEAINAFKAGRGQNLAALAQQPAAVEGAAMKEETLEHQLEHCDGKDCTCAAYGECECACGADWTPAEVYLLRDQVDALRKDAERIRWLAANMRRVYGRREVGGYDLPDIATVESYREYCDPQHLRAAIDAAMNGAND